MTDKVYSEILMFLSLKHVDVWHLKNKITFYILKMRNNFLTIKRFYLKNINSMGFFFWGGGVKG